MDAKFRSIVSFIEGSEKVASSVIGFFNKVNQAVPVMKRTASLIQVVQNSLPVDIKKCHGNYFIIVDMPGVTEYAVEVEDRNVIAIVGKRDANDEHGEEYVLQERKVGSFLRKIPLPADAQLRNGVPVNSYTAGVLTVKVNYNDGSIGPSLHEIPMF